MKKKTICSGSAFSVSTDGAVVERDLDISFPINLFGLISLFSGHAL
jgi:hypothetical protein